MWCNCATAGSVVVGVVMAMMRFGGLRWNFSAGSRSGFAAADGAGSDVMLRYVILHGFHHVVITQSLMHTPRVFNTNSKYQIGLTLN